MHSLYSIVNMTKYHIFCIEIYLSVDCPNGDDELGCPAELMALIEAELGQCIKPSTSSPTGGSEIGPCLEADFDQQRDCVCTGK